MKKILVIVSALMFVAACAAPPTNQSTPVATNAAPSPASATMNEADAIAKEKSVWAALEKKDFDAFGSLLASDYLEVEDSSTNDKTSVMNFVKDLEISNPTYSDWKVMPIDKDAVLLTYSVTVKGSIKGKEFPSGPYRASSAWVNRDGKWLGIYHQETLASTTPMTPAPAHTPAAKSSASTATKTPAATTAADALSSEKLAWDALKRKDYDAFASLLDPTQIEVETDGVYDKAGTVKGVQTFDASKFTLSDFKTANLDSDASLVTYVIKSADPKAPKERHTTIWVNRGGKWLSIFHQGTPEIPASTMAAPKASPSASPKAEASPKVSASPAAKTSPAAKATPKKPA